MKILIVKRDKLGDMLLTTPLLECLRHALPRAEIHVLANDYNAWVLDGNADVDRVWVYRRVKHAGKVRVGAAFEQLRQIARLRAERFDWIIVANGDASTRALKRARWLAGKHVVSYVSAKHRAGISHPLTVPHTGHESERLAALAQALDLRLPATLPAPKFFLPTESASFATQWLAERGLQQGQYLVLGLGARRAKKQPTTQQILRWSKHFYEQWGLGTVFMWTPGASDNPLYPGDDEVAQPVLDAGSEWLHPFRGPLKPALGLIWSARTSLFPDSGLMHFAAASPGGVLGFFADTSVSPPPAQWAPLGARARWLEAPQAVSQLSDDEVLQALDELRQSRPARESV